MCGPATPADISSRTRSTCPCERRRTHHRGPNGRFRCVNCHCRIGDYRAGRGLLGLASSLTFTCSAAPAAWRYSPQHGAPLFGEQSAGLFYACGYHLPQRSVVRIRRCALLATASAHSNVVEVFWFEPWTDLRKMFRDHVEVFLPLSE